MNGCFIPSNSLLYHWALKRDPFVLRSLCFLVLSFEPFQSYLGCVVCPRDPGPLTVFGILAWFFLLGFFWLTNLGRLGLSFVSWVLKLVPPWVFGSQLFGPLILFFFFPCFSSLGEHNSFISLVLFLMELAQCVISLGLGL